MSRTIPKHVLESLSSMPVFSGCTPKQLATMASIGTMINVEPGYVLTRQGRRGFEFFVILEGEARCTIDDVEVARLRAGEFFGEMGLIDKLPRSATVIAETPMKTLVIDAREFSTMVEVAPSTANKLLQAMSRRLRNAQ